MDHTRSRRRDLRKKANPVEPLDCLRRRATVVKRRQRIAKRRIEMHRATPGTHRPPHGVHHRLPQIPQPRLVRLGHREFMEKVHMTAE